MRLLKDYDIMGVDQGVIYAAINVMNVTTRIQTYKPDNRYDPWFALGYYCRDAAAAQFTTRTAQL
jgi:hypothetical protein